MFTNSTCSSASLAATLTVGTAPRFTLCPGNITVNNDACQSSALVPFSVTAGGTPAPSLVCTAGTTPITSPYRFPVGTSTVVCTASNSCGSAACAFTVSVVYAWSGVLQPVNADGSSVFKLGSTVPVAFQLTGASACVTTLAATLSYSKLSPDPPGPVNKAGSTSAATTGNLFRYDPKSGQYIFNWGTKGLTSGKYQLQINLGDGVIHTVTVGLK
jgi:hypothetical protein